MAAKRGLCFAMAPGASKKKKTAPLAAGLFDDPNADPPEEIPPVRSVANATPAFDQFTTNEEAGRRKALGDSLAEQGRFKEALDEWLKALQLTPKDPKLYEQRAQVLIEIDCPFEAVQAAQQAVALDERFLEGLLTLGRAQMAIGELVLAEQSLLRAQLLEGSHREVALELRQVRGHMNRQRDLHLTNVQVRDSFMLIRQDNDLKQIRAHQEMVHARSQIPDTAPQPSINDKFVVKTTTAVLPVRGPQGGIIQTKSTMPRSAAKSVPTATKKGMQAMPHVEGTTDVEMEPMD